MTREVIEWPTMKLRFVIKIDRHGVQEPNTYAEKILQVRVPVRVYDDSGRLLSSTWEWKNIPVIID